MQTKLSNNRVVLDIDLFAGAGGLAIGLRRAGFTPIDVYEIDKTACMTLTRNSGSGLSTLVGNVHEQDVRQTDWITLKPSVRLLAAGAPCQPFSLSGNHGAHADHRNMLPEVVRAARELRPQAILMENVQGLLRTEFRPYFEYILRAVELPSLRQRKNETWEQHDKRLRQEQCHARYVPDYLVSWRLLEAADFGVPQMRKRVFIVATRCDLPVFRFPSPTHSEAELRLALATAQYWEERNLKPPKGWKKQSPQASPRDPARIRPLPWRTVRDAIRCLPEPARSEEGSEMNHWVIPGARSYPGHIGSNLDWPSKTIKAGVHGVPGGENTIIGDNGRIRYYTLREAARLQTFPDEHYFEGSRLRVTKQLGNAVPCTLATAVSLPLMAVLAHIKIGELWVESSERAVH